MAGKVKNYSLLRIGGHKGMMDKTMLNWAAVPKGTEHRYGIFTYNYGDCNEADSISVFSYSQRLPAIDP